VAEPVPVPVPVPVPAPPAPPSSRPPPNELLALEPLGPVALLELPPELGATELAAADSLLLELVPVPETTDVGVPFAVVPAVLLVDPDITMTLPPDEHATIAVTIDTAMDAEADGTLGEMMNRIL
jgi:hypothetical protein